MSGSARAGPSGLGAHVAFFGSTTLLAREIRQALEGRAFAVADVKLYDTAQEGAVSEFAGEALLVTSPDEEAIFGLDLAFLCGTPEQMAPYLDWPERRGFVAIDLSGAARGRAGVPMVHADINPEVLAREAGDPRSLIAVPHPVAHNLAAIIAAARGAGDLGSVEALALRPVADLGEPGIDELYRQTLGLLNFSSVPQEVFGRQIAFNLLPSAAVPSEAQRIEDRIVEETMRVLEPGGAGLHLVVRSAFVPVFHGHSLAVSLRFRRPPDPEALRDSFAAARGVRLVTEAADFSPVDLAGEERVAVLGPTIDPGRPEEASLWSFCDNLKGGAALNAIRVAERACETRRSAVR